MQRCSQIASPLRIKLYDEISVIYRTRDENLREWARSILFEHGFINKCDTQANLQCVERISLMRLLHTQTIYYNHIDNPICDNEC